MKQFAPEYERDEQGFILFPRDSSYRKQLFPRLKLDEHPAKANIYMVQAIVDYVSSENQTVCDIMAGTGTIMTAALIGRRVICLEIEEFYQQILEQNLADIDKYVPGISDMITIIPGDCFVVLPIPLDHIIFSPPYSSIFKVKKTDKFQIETQMGGLEHYSKNPMNVGNLNDFLYNERMGQIYKKCYETLPIGGTLTIIIKDHIEQTKRVYLSRRAKQMCEKIGFEPVSWHRWKPPGSSFIGIRKSKGLDYIAEEEIITLRRLA